MITMRLGATLLACGLLTSLAVPVMASAQAISSETLAAPGGMAATPGRASIGSARPLAAAEPRLGAPMDAAGSAAGSVPALTDRAAVEGAGATQLGRSVPGAAAGSQALQAQADQAGTSVRGHAASAVSKHVASLHGTRKPATKVAAAKSGAAKVAATKAKTSRKLVAKTRRSALPKGNAVLVPAING